MGTKRPWSYIALAAVAALLVAMTVPASAAHRQVIGVGYDGAGLGDLSFHDMAHEGLVQAQEDFPIFAKELDQFTDGGQFLPLTRVTRTLANTSDMVIGISFLFVDPVLATAPHRPDVNFVIVDSAVEWLTDAPNVAGITFAHNEGSFLVGAAAAMTSESDVIGFIGGLDIPIIHEFEVGFTAGVHHVNPDTTVLIDYLPGFVDPAPAYGAGVAMYDAGADVVFHAAGFAGIGLFEAARDFSLANSHVWAIGVDADQYLAVPADLQPHILTSMMKRVDLAVYNAIEAQVTGTFMPGDHQLDLAAGGLDYATSGGFIDDLVGDLEALRADIISGAIVVPNP